MNKDDATWLNITYVLFAMLVAYVAYKALHTVGMQVGWAERYDEWFPTVNNVVALTIGTAASLWLRSNADRREYHIATIAELRKVSWPSLPDTKKMTYIVVVVVAIFSVILTVFDVLWSKALQLVLP